MLGYKHTCIDTYSYMDDTDIVIFVLSTTVHTCMVLVFPHFCFSGISIFLQIKKFGNSRNTEIQKSEIMYVCRKASMCIYVYVCMYGYMKMEIEQTLPQPPLPFKDQQASSIINVCVFVNTNMVMDIEYSPSTTTAPSRTNKYIPS